MTTPLARFELATCALEVHHSVQLSYRGKIIIISIAYLTYTICTLLSFYSRKIKKRPLFVISSLFILPILLFLFVLLVPLVFPVLLIFLVLPFLLALLVFLLMFQPFLLVSLSQTRDNRTPFVFHH